MTAGRVLATQQARDAAKQLLALTRTVKDKVGKVLQHGGVLADPKRWEGGVAGKWRNDWHQDSGQLNQASAKFDEFERRAHQVVEDIFKADSASHGPQQLRDGEDFSGHGVVRKRGVHEMTAYPGYRRGNGGAGRVMTRV